MFCKKELILSAGSFDTPKLLMLSGIGPKDELSKHDIPIVADLPGVGQGLRDHCSCRMSFLRGTDASEDEVRKAEAQVVEGQLEPLASPVVIAAGYLK